MQKIIPQKFGGNKLSERLEESLSSEQKNSRRRTTPSCEGKHGQATGDIGRFLQAHLESAHLQSIAHGRSEEFEDGIHQRKNQSLERDKSLAHHNIGNGAGFCLEVEILERMNVKRIGVPAANSGRTYGVKANRM